MDCCTNARLLKTSCPKYYNMRACVRRCCVRAMLRACVSSLSCLEVCDAFFKIYFWAALPEILGGVRIGFIRAVKGVIIGQLLISIVGFGALFELYSANFLMKHFWAVLLVLFALAFLIAEFLAYLERRVAYYAARRSV